MWDSDFLGLSQKPGTVPGLWDSPRTLGQSQDFGTVPGLWDFPRSPGKSLDVRTVPKTQSLNTMGVISQSQRPKSLGQSQDFGTVPDAVPGGWDYPKDPESQHHGGYFLISETQKRGTVPGL